MRSKMSPNTWRERRPKQTAHTNLSRIEEIQILVWRFFFIYGNFKTDDMFLQYASKISNFRTVSDSQQTFPSHDRG